MAIETKQQTAVPVAPPWITSKDCARRYRSGIAWYRCSTNERMPEPLTEQYLLDNLKWMSKKGLFNGAHDDWALEELGFILGMLSQEQ